LQYIDFDIYSLKASLVLSLYFTLYNGDMSDSHSSLYFLGLVFTIAGTFAAAHVLIESSFQLSLFSVFWKITPRVLQSFSPISFPTWLSIRAQTDVHEAWDVALFFFVTVSFAFTLMAGCWVFLILAILGIYHIGTFWLITWFVILFFIYLVSASNQVAIEGKFKHPRAKAQRRIRYMQQQPFNTIKRWLYFMFRNWLISPFTSLVVLLILCLLLLLDGFGWLTMLLPQSRRLDLTNNTVRMYYYGAYSLFFVVAGLLLMSV
jgi:hypothetical protein